MRGAVVNEEGRTVADPDSHSRGAHCGLGATHGGGRQPEEVASTHDGRRSVPGTERLIGSSTPTFEALANESEVAVQGPRIPHQLGDEGARDGRGSEVELDRPHRSQSTDTALDNAHPCTRDHRLRERHQAQCPRVSSPLRHGCAHARSLVGRDGREQIVCSVLDQGRVSFDDRRRQIVALGGGDGPAVRIVEGGDDVDHVVPTQDSGEFTPAHDRQPDGLGDAERFAIGRFEHDQASRRSVPEQCTQREVECAEGTSGHESVVDADRTGREPVNEQLAQVVQAGRR